MELSEEDRLIRDAALEFARAHKKSRCGILTDPSVFLPEVEPVCVFMAGSPGAGKTESSKELIATMEARTSPPCRVLRIDPDDLRSEFPGYTGSNSWLFQGAVSIWVGRMLDLALEQSQSFLLDGTLSNLAQARQNIKRCLKRHRTVQILYVYQDPVLAWNFVQAREAQEGRHIPPEQFITQYFAAREVVNSLKTEFGTNIALDLLLKPNDASPKLYRAGIDQIDYHVPEKYDTAQLRRLLEP